MIEPISAANWRAAVAFDPATLELMARAYLGLGRVPVVEFDGDVVVRVWPSADPVDLERDRKR